MRENSLALSAKLQATEMRPAAFWLEVLHDLGMTEAPERTRLEGEANQLVAIMVSSKKTARAAEASKRPARR